MSENEIPGINDDTTNELFIKAIDAWCEQFPPSENPNEAGQQSMYDILDALNSFYGLTNGFTGTAVLVALRERGYQSIYDAASNQFKILVSN